MLKPKNPMQPIVDGRFKSNAIVDALLEHAQKHGFGLNEIGRGDFSQDDRCQFAQLTGYSLSGYSELRSYVSDEEYATAVAVSNGVDPRDARIEVLETTLREVRAMLAPPMAVLFGINSEDLLSPDGREP